MQNAANTFGNTYRAKAYGKKLAKTIEFPLTPEDFEIERESVPRLSDRSDIFFVLGLRKNERGAKK